MKQGRCWCSEKESVVILRDGDKNPIYKLDGLNAMLRIRISKKQGIVGLPIIFCPYCGRRLANDEPRCPENLTAKVVGHEATD